MKDNKQPLQNIYLIGGFLGSGKTTAIVNACRILVGQDKRVAVITNDQGDQQVDSGYVQGLLLPNAEVANGCFCCNYGELEKHVLQFNESGFPEYIFAESVGSCTDLVATIAKPFALFHPDFRVIISVFADAPLLYSIVQGTSMFIEDSVQYIYKKQLEEADIIIINKTDLLADTALQDVKEVVQSSYAGKLILYQDSHNEKDIDTWLSTLAEYPVPSSRKALDLDYDIYGAGEAALAWLDKMVTIHTVMPVAADAAITLAGTIGYKIKQAGYTIGHLKFLLEDDGWVRKISYTGGGNKNIYLKGEHACKHLSVLINARVQTSPQLLQDIVADAIHETMMKTGCRIVPGKEHAFQPGYPKPVYRMADI